MTQRQPVTARVYDCWLGGTNNFPEDRAHAERMMTFFPDIREISLANRAFLGRAVRALAEQGVDQFLDLGSGLPNEGNVHEVAREVIPDARIVYVDVDPVAAELGRAMLSGTDGVEYLRADLRNPQAVLGSEEVARCLDLTRPVALLMVAMLQFVMPQDDPARVVASYRDATAPGSYLVVSHATDEYHPQQMRDVADVYNSATLPITMRNREQIAGLLAGYELLEPGLVEPVRWRPQKGDYDPFDGDAARYNMLAAVGRRS